MARAHAARTVASASFADIVMRAWPANCVCHSVSVGAVVNMWAAGGWLVGPYRQNKSAAAESMAPMAFSAHRSHKSRAAWRSVHVEVFDAANAGSVGTRSSAGGASV